MKSAQVAAHRDRINAVFDSVKPGQLDPQMVSHLSRYLCVLASGFVEESVRLIVSDYATRNANVEVSRYVRKRLERFVNPALNNILCLVAEFDPELRTSIETQMGEDVRAAIQGVVDNRHQIAHGRNIGIGLPTIREYWKNVVRGVELLEKTFS